MSGIFEVSNKERKAMINQNKESHVDINHKIDEAIGKSNGVVEEIVNFEVDDQPVVQQQQTVKEQEPVKKLTKKERAMKKNKKVPVPGNIKSDVIVQERGKDWNKISLYLVAIGIIGIIFFSQMANDINPAFIILIWLFGMMCFLPLGLIVGWLFLDPYMRCKIMRRLRGRNFGIVHLVHRGGQKIATRIKDFDEDVIIQDGRFWMLKQEGIYYKDKENNNVLHSQISAEDIKTLPANIPCVFIDVESMQVITFNEEDTSTNPQEAGAFITGYIENQIRKNAMFKKSQTILFIIILGIAFVTMIITFQLYTWVEEMNKTIPALRGQIQTLGNRLAELQPPVNTTGTILSKILWWI